MQRKLYLFLLSSLLVTLPVLADGNLLVGTIDVQATVSESGGAVVSIPIDVPAGINGMQPSLSLVYNSQSGYGIAGWGWSLSGISSITRTGSNSFYDDNICGVKFTTEDNLTLDGQRLILKSGNNLSPGAVYHTAVETFNKVQYQLTGNGFQVQSKDGTTSLYGNSYTSRLSYGPFYTLSWYLSRTTDTNGNSMAFSYNVYDEPSQIYLTKIEYAGSAGTDSVYSVSFQYRAAPHARTSLMEMEEWSVPAIFAQTKLLERIDIKYKGTLLYSYSLTYDTSDVEPRLVSVTKEDAGGNHFNPVNVVWNAAGTGSNTTSTMSLSAKSNVLYADFTGDGRTDVLTYTSGNTAAVLYKNTSSIASVSYTPVSITLDEGYNQIWTLDYDGDGRMDIIGRYKVSSSLYRMSCALSNGNGFDTPTLTQNAQSSSQIISGDFDGDGRDEFIISTQNAIYHQERTIPVTFSGIYQSFSGNYNLAKDGSFPLDFNGNGKTDLLFATTDNIYVYELSEDDESMFDCIKQTSFSSLGVNGTHDETKFLFGDYNGDGTTDFIYYGYDSNTQDYYLEARLCLSAPQTFLLERTDLLYSSPSSPSLFLRSADVNGDRLPDVVNITGSGTSATIRISLNTGDSFSSQSQSVSGITWSSAKSPSLSDMNGDGMADIVCLYGTSQVITKKLYSGNVHLVSSVTDGLGNAHQFTYRTLAGPEVYASTFQGNYPFGELRGSLCVVSSYSAPFVSRQYLYGKAVMHKGGKGFLGFGTVTETDALTNRVTVRTKSLSTYYAYMYPSGDTVRTTGGQPVSQDAFEYFIKGFDNDRRNMFPQLTTAVHADCLTTLRDSTRFVYDNYGNISVRIKYKGNLSEHRGFTYTSAGSWCDNRIVRESAYNYYGGESSSYRSIDYEYDNRGNVIRQVDDSLIYGKKLVHRYTYDTFGNMTGETVTDGTQTRTSSTVWAASGRYPLSSTDELGMTTTFTYNDTTGLLRSSVSAVGTTAYTYDAFGRPVQTTYPDGAVATVSREYITGAGSVRYAVTETRTKSPVQTTYYNSSGMPLFTKSVGFASRQTYTACGYNTDGSKQYVSEPFYASSLSDAASRTFTEADATLYTYDAYGRTKTVRSPAGNSTYAYGGLTTDVTTSEGTFGSTMNSAGFVITRTIHDDGFSVEPDLPIEPPRSHVDNSRSIHYTYYPTGQVKTVTPDGSTAITLQYDGKGNRTSMADPDAGTVTDTYNAFGQVMTHSQPIHNGTATTTYSYSSTSGQLLSETTVGNSTQTKTYTYHATLKDLPVRIAYNATDYVAYTYDSRGRQTGCTRVKGSETVSDTYTYGAGSLVSQHNHNGKTLETFTYDTYGNQTAEGLTPYATTWQLLDVNARGQVLREQKGSIVTTYTYDNAGRMLSMKAPNIVNLTYTYDEAGNLLSKTDSITEQTVTYGYDGKNRLTAWNVKTFLQPLPVPDGPRSEPLVVVDSTFTMTYDETTGNILTKSDMGEDAAFNYVSSGKPHALYQVSDVATDWGTDAVVIAYTDFGKVRSVTEGDYSYSIDYSPDGARVKSYLTDGNGGYTVRYYGNGTEKAVGDNYNLDYLSYLCHGAIVVHHGTGRHAPPPETPVPPTPTAVLQGYYDAQGSLIALVNASGNVVRRFAYDPWGRRVDPDDWTQDDTQAELYHINRGYTMHEHLREFGLINMNGRVFDPAVAQFLSPDNYIQDAGNWLNYNRYAYCFNNPLKYTDPSGEKLVVDVHLGYLKVYYHDDILQYVVGFSFSWSGDKVFSLFGGVQVGGETIGLPNTTEVGIIGSLNWNISQKNIYAKIEASAKINMELITVGGSVSYKYVLFNYNKENNSSNDKKRGSFEWNVYVRSKEPVHFIKEELGLDYFPEFSYGSNGLKIDGIGTMSLTYGKSSSPSSGAWKEGGVNEINTLMETKRKSPVSILEKSWPLEINLSIRN